MMYIHVYIHAYIYTQVYLLQYVCKSKDFITCNIKIMHKLSN